MKFDVMNSIEEVNDVSFICVKGLSLCYGEWKILGLAFGCDGLLKDVDG